MNPSTEAVSPPAFSSPLPPVLSESALNRAEIFILDDEPMNVVLLERMLEEAGYHAVQSSTDSRSALETLTENPPDLLLLDLMMPHLNGFGLMQTLRSVWGREQRVPILVLTADASRETCHRALSAGASDFLSKPIDRTELMLRVQNLLENRLLFKELRAANRHLEERVQLRTRDLEIAQIEALEKLAQAAEFRDDDTGEHTQRVGALAAQLSARLGLSPDRVELILRAAPLHDIGKIAIPDAVLLKPARLTPEEFALMKTHAEIGARLLSHSTSPLMQCAETIARSHHERFDGSGYPHQLHGEAIPLEGRIVAVVDVFDALTNERPYKKAWPIPEALTEIERCAGTHFDPKIVSAFVSLVG